MEDLFSEVKVIGLTLNSQLFLTLFDSYSKLKKTVVNEILAYFELTTFTGINIICYLRVEMKRKGGGMMG